MNLDNIKYKEIGLETFKNKIFECYKVKFTTTVDFPCKLVYSYDLQLLSEDSSTFLKKIKELPSYVQSGEIYIFTDKAYDFKNDEAGVFIIDSSDLILFIETHPLDFFDLEPMFINFNTNKAFVYTVEGRNDGMCLFFDCIPK